MADSFIIPFTLYTVGIWWCLSTWYKPMIGFLKGSGMVRPNFKGKEIPLAVGIAIPIVQALSIPWSILEGVERIYLVQVFFLSFIAYVGWRDDRYGEKETKGIKGHVSLWWRTGRWSTGLWKAMVGSTVALVVSTLYSSSIWEWILHVGLIVLLTNQINLLDLRPGRAIKGFLLYVVIVLAFITPIIPISLWLPLVLTALFLYREDIRGQAMIGDIGSNTLGFAVAFWLVVYASLGLKVVVFLGGVLIQLYAEKRSISTLIQKTPVLYWLDMLGRRKT